MMFFRAQRAKNTSFFEVIDFCAEYLNKLCYETDYKFNLDASFCIKKVHNLLNLYIFILSLLNTLKYFQGVIDKTHNLSTFRDVQFMSPFTGTEGVPFKVKSKCYSERKICSHFLFQHNLLYPVNHFFYFRRNSWTTKKLRAKISLRISKMRDS